MSSLPRLIRILVNEEDTEVRASVDKFIQTRGFTGKDCNSRFQLTADATFAIEKYRKAMASALAGILQADVFGFYLPTSPTVIGISSLSHETFTTVDKLANKGLSNIPSFGNTRFELFTNREHAGRRISGFTC